jgi:hypothetical protein
MLLCVIKLFKYLIGDSYHNSPHLRNYFRMKIQFKPIYEMAEVTHVMSNTVWKLNEIKDIPEDASFRLRIGTDVYQKRVIDDLLSDPNYVMAEGGEVANPNYECAECGAPTLEIGETNQFGTTLYFENEEGERLCKDCFAKPTPVPEIPDKEIS